MRADHKELPQIHLPSIAKFEAAKLTRTDARQIRAAVTRLTHAT
jgi:hypothetical protein